MAAVAAVTVVVAAVAVVVAVVVVVKPTATEPAYYIAYVRN